jgi:hypothetical protein
MMESPFFGAYAPARQAFLEAASAAGAGLEAYTHPETGPEGEVLATDVAWLGPRDAEAVFVTVSGTHGVEGHCGSGAQVDWLRRGEAARLPAGMAAMLVHAINPYGFAWSRRVTHENVDLNRNFVDHAGPLPSNPGYDELADALCPPVWNDETRAAGQMAVGAYARAHGWPAMTQAVSGGQYNHPKGIFYGGTKPTWSRTTLTEILSAHLGQAAHIGILDYHTGLGPAGFGEQIITDARDTDAFTRASRWFGAAVIPAGGADSASAPISGDWLAAAPGLAPNAKVTSIAVEFGTVDGLNVVAALRADSWLHAYGDPNSDEGRAIRRQMRDAFYLDSDLWRGMVLGQALSSSRQAVAGLTAELG